MNASMSGYIKYIVLHHVLTSFKPGHWELQKKISSLSLFDSDNVELPVGPSSCLGGTLSSVTGEEWTGPLLMSTD